MVLGALFDIGIAICPVIGYVYQYHLISKKQSPGTFSIDICGILIFANIMRINFYIFNQYQLALFFQSIFMISVQIMLLKICTKYAKTKMNVGIVQVQNNKNQLNQVKQKFWRWDQFEAYVGFLVKFVIIIFSISILFAFLDFKAYGVIIGLVALLSQSVLILPQIIKNYKKGEVKGLSHFLVILNLLGDIIKLIYFLIKTQPFQFVLCGIIQVILDSFVIMQIIFYKIRAKNKFQKQNKSLIVQRNKQRKGQTQDNIQVELGNVQNIVSPHSNNSYDQDDKQKQIDRDDQNYEKITTNTNDFKNQQNQYINDEQPQTGDRFSKYDKNERVELRLNNGQTNHQLKQNKNDQQIKKRQNLQENQWVQGQNNNFE